MIDHELKYHLEQRFDLKIESVSALTGGDINAAYLLSTKQDSYVLKTNNRDAFPNLFQKEANGLKVLKSANALDFPQVFGHGEYGNTTFLILEYKPTSKKNSLSRDFGNDFWIKFGQQLAQLHQHTQNEFGFFEDNYIGSLPQYNNPKASPAEFFIEQRLQPQFNLALDQGYHFKEVQKFYTVIEELIPIEPPALIHGDLWSGNYLVNLDQTPCLIDPAVAYAPREMDLAMMKLFGGFDERMFEAYHRTFPLEHDWEERIPMWQLYYVLAHVNLFGGHYYRRAKELMNMYL